MQDTETSSLRRSSRLSTSSPNPSQIRTRRASASSESTVSKEIGSRKVQRRSKTPERLIDTPTRGKRVTRSESKSPSAAKGNSVAAISSKRRASTSNLRDKLDNVQPPTRVTRRSTRSGSKSPTMEMEPSPQPENTKKRGRRPSVTDKVVPMDAIEESGKEIGMTKTATNLNASEDSTTKILTHKTVLHRSAAEVSSSLEKEKKDTTSFITTRHRTRQYSGNSPVKGETQIAEEEVFIKSKKQLAVAIGKPELHVITETSFTEDDKENRQSENSDNHNTLPESINPRNVEDKKKSNEEKIATVVNSVNSNDISFKADALMVNASNKLQSAEAKSIVDIDIVKETSPTCSKVLKIDLVRVNVTDVAKKLMEPEVTKNADEKCANLTKTGSSGAAVATEVSLVHTEDALKNVTGLSHKEQPSNANKSPKNSSYCEPMEIDLVSDDDLSVKSQSEEYNTTPNPGNDDEVHLNVSSDSITVSEAVQELNEKENGEKSSKVMKNQNDSSSLTNHAPLDKIKDSSIDVHSSPNDSVPGSPRRSLRLRHKSPDKGLNEQLENVESESKNIADSEIEKTSSPDGSSDVLGKDKLEISEHENSKSPDLEDIKNDRNKKRLSSRKSLEENKSKEVSNQEKLDIADVDNVIEILKSSSPHLKKLADNIDSKIDELLRKNPPRYENSDSDASVTDFLDDMADEGEESTPSEDNNEIVDDGESVGFSDSNQETDGSYESNSFIDDDEVNDLLSGEEYDLSLEKKQKKKKSRIIKMDVSDEDSATDFEIEANATSNFSKLKRNSTPLVKKSLDKPATPIKSPGMENSALNGVLIEKDKNQVESDSDIDKMSTKPYCGLTPPSIMSVRDSPTDSDFIKQKHQHPLKANLKDLSKEDSSTTNDEDDDFYINDQDDLKSLEKIQLEFKSKRASVKLDKAVKVVGEETRTETGSNPNKENSFQANASSTELKTAEIATALTPNNTILVESPKSAKKSKLNSSITINDSIKLNDLEEGQLGNHIIKIVDLFCTELKNKSADISGNISLSLSLDFVDADSPKNEGNPNSTSTLNVSKSKMAPHVLSHSFESCMTQSKSKDVAVVLQTNINKDDESTPKIKEYKTSKLKENKLNATLSRSLEEKVEEDVHKKQNIKKRDSAENRELQETNKETFDKPKKHESKKRDSVLFEKKNFDNLEETDGEVVHIRKKRKIIEVSEELKSLPETKKSKHKKKQKLEEEMCVADEEASNIASAEEMILLPETKKSKRKKKQKLEEEMCVVDEEASNIASAEEMILLPEIKKSKHKKKRKQEEEMCVVNEEASNIASAEELIENPMQKDKKKKKKSKKKHEVEYLSDDVFYPASSNKDQEIGTNRDTSQKESKTSKKKKKAHPEISSNIDYFPKIELEKLVHTEKPKTMAKTDKSSIPKPSKIMKSKGSWESAEIDSDLKPTKGKQARSESFISLKTKKPQLNAYDSKDFKNRMMFHSSRVKRMETKTLLKRKEKNPI